MGTRCPPGLICQRKCNTLHCKISLDLPASFAAPAYLQQLQQLHQPQLE